MKKFKALILLFILIFCDAFAGGTCVESLKNYLAGAEFLHSRNQNFHSSSMIQNNRRNAVRRGERFPNDPVHNIASWLQTLERTHLGHRDNELVADRIRNHYLQAHVIAADEVPDGYFELQRRIMREQGHGR